MNGCCNNEELLLDDLQAELLAKSEYDLQKRLATAMKHCIDFLRRHPEDANVYLVQGIYAFLCGRLNEAENLMIKALCLSPQSIPILYNYAIILMHQKKNDIAVFFMMRVVELNQGHVKAYWHLGNIYRSSCNLEGSLSAFNKALEYEPNNPEILNDKGNTLAAMNNLAEAAACFEQALSFKPNDHYLLNNLGLIRFMQNDLDAAENLYRTALNYNQAHPEILSNLSATHRLKGNLEEAIHDSRQALTLRPDSLDALNNLGNALKDARRIEEAIVAYRKALHIAPDNADIHKNLSMALLALGHFNEGWREYEWRWQSQQLRHSARNFSRPLWNGEAGEGKTILIHAEQGFGDTLQFCRYAPLIKARGFRVIMAVPPPLKRLVQSLDGVEKVISSTTEEIPSFDLHCPMMSLPLAFRTVPDTIPSEVPYLWPRSADVDKWAERMVALKSNAFKVGLVWSGSARSYSPDLIATDKKRSIALNVLSPLMDVPNIQFFSLQKERAQAAEGFHLIDWMSDCHDFADTAAFITNLDLVISVDTAVAHLAGALGKPVWVINRFNSCWRWFVGRDDSPWYPSLRLFNQKESGNWGEVVLRIRTALEKRFFIEEAEPAPLYEVKPSNIQESLQAL